ncbi:5-histidylcysteine sulfoxide synthase [Reinekea marinisedimentorum]|uniref:5-histidylcysteine sulfoxide synthase/putative 4-mercaptohistidine N1-methyltransferase n=1 Tax=Reinekea marinisedimentorum TaxID=230495 RepID=A0A4R3IDR1_9GAMM|nr:5-histidylcysteine sulfoxide synthase [Reinekea marinisedimentorum]TCS43916.1 5-histidylcysteine sulfoxide synthase/putative 4-mercaptohistidine N1-methyltransferase [Reinekea marinisedimentorum]
MQIDRAHQTISLHGDDAEAKRHEIKHYFNQTWLLYENLFEVINNDAAYYKKAEPLRHPLIFYFGHTACFYINKLKLAKLIDERINPRLESMFAIGVDEMSWDDLDSANYSWPKVDEAREYRNQVRARVNELIDTLPIKLPITQQDPAWVILMGIEHERIHLETSSVIIRQLPLEDVSDHPDWAICPDVGTAPENSLINIAGGEVSLGRTATDDAYGWDNEYGHHSESVSDFQASALLVSNGEFMAFVEDGGYEKLHYWSEEGQSWLNYTQAKCPRFWLKTATGWQQRNMTNVISLPMNWPVEVNQLEAKAFCNWKAEKTGEPVRLPTEAEWKILSQRVPKNNPVWDEVPGNIQLAYYASSCPVNRFGHEGLFDVVGNVWQWTETPIDGYSGFAVHPLYDDFSTPTFDGKHNLIKGGSWISTGNEALPVSRYAFRRHFYQHAGLRYVVSEQPVLESGSVNIYETDELVSQYLEFHYGAEYFGVANFPVAVVEHALREVNLPQQRKALDIGCSVGRASFELARHFEQVDAIDFSARFIQQAYALVEQGERRYTIATEGELVDFKSVTLQQLGYSDVKEKIYFSQGDATNLKAQFSGYDLVFACNLIDRLTDPMLFLNAIPARMNTGGYLVIASPYTWLEQYTPKDKWLGGIKINGENQTTLDGLTEALIGDFELVSVKEIPFVIRETKRKFQHTVSEVTVWRKR